MTKSRSSAHYEKDLRTQRRLIREGKAAARTPEQNRELMITAIITAVRDRGHVTVDDLSRAGIPKDIIAAQFKSALALAKDRAPDIEQMIATA